MARRIEGEGEALVKVIGAGFGRTGTLSLKAALEELGFGPCYHMTEVFRHPEHAPLWEAAARGEPVDWDRFLAGYQATVDWPACNFYEPLMRRYPDAKVVLTVRDPQRWYASTASTIYRMHQITAISPLTATLFALIGRFVAAGRVTRMINAVVWKGTFEGNFADQRQAIAIFERHIQEVKERVPADRLLVYDVQEGWAPLCAFLGVPVPNGRPFPHLNDAESFQKMVRQRWTRTFAPMIAVAVLAALALLVRQRRV